MSQAMNPYKELYASPNGPGDQRPTALQIVEDEGLVNKWTDDVVLVTGATSAVGLETARALHTTGAHVYITARNMDKAKAAVKHILDGSKGAGKVDVIPMDMMSLDSVKHAAQDFLSKSDKLNVLVCNAGIMATPKGATEDGFETQFGVNHLAHFTLTAMLLPTLIRSSTPERNSRVVAVSSSAHRWSSVHWDDLNLDKDYEPFVAYAQSKTCNVWMANHIDRVYGPRGVHAFSLHPGGIWSGLQKHVDAELQRKWKENRDGMIQMMSTEQGAATSVWAATAEVLEGKGGKYLANCAVSPPSEDLVDEFDVGSAPHAFDEEGATRLWGLSSKLAGVTVVE